jgi:hypothetical protein
VVHFLTDEDMLDGVAGEDGETTGGAAEIGGGGVALGFEPEVAELVGDDEGFVIGGSVLGVDENEREAAFGAVVGDAEGLGGFELVLKIGVIGELFEDLLVFEGGGDGFVGRETEEENGLGAGFFDFQAPEFEGTGEENGQQDGRHDTMVAVAYAPTVRIDRGQCGRDVVCPGEGERV